MLDTHDEYGRLFENAPDLLYAHDLSGNITRVNRAFEVVTGYPRAEATKMNIIDLVAPDWRGIVQDKILVAAGGANPQMFELEIVGKWGQRHQLEVSCGLIFREGRPVGIQGLARDVSEKRRRISAHEETEAQLVEKTGELATFTRYLQLLHRLSTASYAHIDHLFAEYLNTGCEIFGLPAGEILQAGRNSQVMLKARRGSSEGSNPCSLQVLRSRRTLVSWGADSCSGGQFIGAPIIVNDSVFGSIGFWSEDGNAGELHPHASQIVELMAKAIAGAIHQRQLTDELAYQARHDALTGLPNRLMLSERLTAALQEARESGTIVAVVFIDLDRFKQINDTLGHFVGDEVLRSIAARLSKCMNEGETLARMGGDEFTAILTGINSRSNAIAAARRLLNLVRKPCRVESYELFVTASVGISFFPADGEDVPTLLRNADAAMYSAKYRGKNDVHCYQAESTATALQRLELENLLRRALERHELRMLYQPQVDLEGNLAGMEVLLQWDQPDLGRIAPAQFIPIAEETGMILVIGSWVLRNACLVMARWHRLLGATTPIAVNVSALQFAQANFVETVSDLLAESGLPAESLELELTESLVMRDIEQSTQILRELRELGVRIAIDDFGTGYSSLSYLRRLPADALKIDQSFLTDIEDETSTFALINAVVVLGHSFGLAVTAEGVETQRQLELVRRTGCDRIQGHFFGAALTANAIEDLLRRSAAGGKLPMP